MSKDAPPPYGNPPPAPGFTPDVSSSHQHTVIISPGPTVVLGPNPQYMVCPSCRQQITTDIKTEPNSKTHLFALLLCLFGCWCCCCFPYCMDSCQGTNHYCPNCHAYLGIYNQ